MNLLFGDRFAPITSEIGFLQTDYKTAVEAYLAWQNQILEEDDIILEKEPLSVSLDVALNRLVPLTSPIRCRYLFVPTENNWVAFFDNWWQGTDAAAPMCFLATQLKTTGLRVAAVPDTMPRESTKDSTGRYGSSILEVYNGRDDATRSVFAANDGGKWKFGQSGDPLPFENLEAYKAKRIRDRFDFERLDSYLQKLGVRAFDERFYLPEATLIHRKGEGPPNYEEYQLDQFSDHYLAGR